MWLLVVARARSLTAVVVQRMLRRVTAAGSVPDDTDVTGIATGLGDGVGLGEGVALGDGVALGAGVGLTVGFGVAAGLVATTVAVAAPPTTTSLDRAIAPTNDR